MSTNVFLFFTLLLFLSYKIDSLHYETCLCLESAQVQIQIVHCIIELIKCTMFIERKNSKLNYKLKQF